MGTISKIDDKAIADIAKVDSQAKSTIANMSGQTIESYTDAYGVTLDGTNDYVDVTLSSDPINKTRGTISFWVKLDDSESNAKAIYFLSINNYADTGTTDNVITILMPVVHAVGRAWPVRIDYTTDASGSKITSICNAKNDSPTDHGIPYSRIYTDYGTAASDTEFSGAQAGWFTDGQWHHIAATWDTSETFTYQSTDYNGKMKLYLDGVLRQEGQSSSPAHNARGVAQSFSTMTATMTHIYFGIRSHATSHTYSQFLDGVMNDCAIWDTDLDADAIAAVYNSGQPMNLLADSGNYDNSSNLVGYWKFEENSGTTVFDSSSNSNNGVLTSGALFGAVIYPLHTATYQFEGESTQEGYTSSWSPSNGWVNGTSATDGTYWARTSNKTVKGWNLGQDGTGSSGTGPTGGVNISNGGHYTTTNLDKYMYTEVTGGRHAYCFVARMPAFNSNNMIDATNDLNLKFWAHGYGTNMGDLFVYIHTAATANHSNATELAQYLHTGDASTNRHWSGFTSNSSVWQEKTISLNSYRNGADYYIYFVSQNGTSYRADLAVDAVQIIETE
tara:strand:+ start:4851 stop:6527 length:1677 start_codon:yes stop_codon:yes gene_type:complete